MTQRRTMPRWSAAALALVLGACSERSSFPAEAPLDAATDAADLDARDLDAAEAPPVDRPPASCDPGVDTDFDEVPNDVECREGTDPGNPDTDGDGLRDGRERAYPRVCVAADRARQGRPPTACTSDVGCAAGEACRGLSGAAADSDGDGVGDRAEDPGADGMIDTARGESDPRLWDTDGDGRGDGESGLAICRPDGLVNPRLVNVPRGTFLVGLDPVWPMTPRTVMGATEADGAAVLLDDPALSLAAFAHERAASSADVRVEALDAEDDVVAALGAVPVLVGRALTTHEMLPAVRSVFRVAVEAGDGGAPAGAGALRDRLLARVVGAPAPAGTPMYPAATDHRVEVVTVLRGEPRRRVTLVTVLASAAADDPAAAAAIRADDLVNTSGLADRDRTLDFRCQRFTATGESEVDFLWLVDTSGSMSDDQERLGRTAERFFGRLTAAGVDFRVGVFEAGSMMLNLDDPGFAFINGADPGGARLLAWQVTISPYLMAPRDIFRPYAFPGSAEESVAAGVYAFETLRERTTRGELDPGRRLRSGARTVAFFVTDEPGTNDDAVFRRDAARWGADYPARLRGVVEFFQRNEIQTYGLVADYRTACAVPDVRDMPRCVILNNGGAFIPISTATDPEVAAAMNLVVESVAGVASQYQLDRTPISATLQVRVDGRAVPRSRADGFDYDATARAVVFYGATHRPSRAAEVVISYRVWAGSLG